MQPKCLCDWNKPKRCLRVAGINSSCTPCAHACEGIKLSTATFGTGTIFGVRPPNSFSMGRSLSRANSHWGCSIFISDQLDMDVLAEMGLWGVLVCLILQRHWANPWIDTRQRSLYAPVGGMIKA